MRCSACGQLVQEGTRYCPACGEKITETASESSTAYEQQTNDQTGYREESAQTFEQPERAAKPMPMKWYKFLIYISLILTTVINIYDGISILSGGLYENAAEVYATYQGLKMIDMLYGICSIAFGVYAFVVRQKLAHYRHDGPKCLLILYLVSALMAIVYVLAVAFVTGAGLANTNIWSNIAMSAFMIFVNKIYFDKRAYLFKA
jgi:uncharacterized Zn finger protein (UPF0148 family)